ncbi:MAG: hypothetical protein ACR2MW_07200 [Chthoniobacterales bacterium]
MARPNYSGEKRRKELEKKKKKETNKQRKLENADNPSSPETGDESGAPSEQPAQPL